MTRNLYLRPMRKSPERVVRGEQHHAARLTEADVHLIREFIIELRISPTDVARVFRIHPCHARDIAFGRRWTWLAVEKRAHAAMRARRMVAESRAETLTEHRVAGWRRRAA